MEVVEIRVTESVLEANFGNEAQIEYVPYGRLCRSPLNVRKKAPTGIEALAGTIVGNGLIQNLVVHPRQRVAREAAEAWGLRRSAASRRARSAVLAGQNH
jgi:ParB-like nuclease domain.